jgi:hypothetical protein
MINSNEMIPQLEVIASDYMKSRFGLLESRQFRCHGMRSPHQPNVIGVITDLSQPYGPYPSCLSISTYITTKEFDNAAALFADRFEQDMQSLREFFDELMKGSAKDGTFLKEKQMDTT